MHIKADATTRRGAAEPSLCISHMERKLQPDHDGDVATTSPPRYTSKPMHNAARRSRAILMHLPYGGK